MIIDVLNTFFSYDDYRQFIIPSANVQLQNIVSKSVNIGGAFVARVLPVRAVFDYTPGLNLFPLFSFVLYDFDIRQPSLVKTYLEKTGTTCIHKYFKPSTDSISTVATPSSYLYLMNIKTRIFNKETNATVLQYPPSLFFTSMGLSGSGFNGFLGFDSIHPDQVVVVSLTGGGAYYSGITYVGATVPGRLQINIDLSATLASYGPHTALELTFDMVFQNYAGNNKVLIDVDTTKTIQKSIHINGPDGVVLTGVEVKVFDSSGGLVHTATPAPSNVVNVSFLGNPGTYKYEVTVEYTYQGNTCSRTMLFTEIVSC